VASALITGCSDKVEANMTLPSSSAAETTDALPQVGPADFPVPDEARTKDAAGAEAFFRYYIELINRQQQVPAGQPIRDLGPECQGCLRVARLYDETAQAGNHYAGGGLTLTEVTPPRLDGDGAEMSFSIRQDAVQRVDASGTPVEDKVEELPNVIGGVALTYTDEDQTWVVRALDFQ
jgi:hypothetical protein